MLRLDWGGIEVVLSLRGCGAGRWVSMLGGAEPEAIRIRQNARIRGF